MAHETVAERQRRERWGLLSGATMALGASLSFAAARAGILGGLGVADLIFARFLVAGAIFLPLLVRWGLPTLAGIGFRRAVILTLLGRSAVRAAADGGLRFCATDAWRRHCAVDRYHRQHHRCRGLPVHGVAPLAGHSLASWITTPASVSASRSQGFSASTLRAWSWPAFQRFSMPERVKSMSLV